MGRKVFGHLSLLNYSNDATWFCQVMHICVLISCIHMQINQAMYVGTCKFFHGIFHYQTTMLPIWTLSLQTSSGNAVEFLQGYVHFYMLSYMLLTLKRTDAASHLLNMQVWRVSQRLSHSFPIPRGNPGPQELNWPLKAFNLDVYSWFEIHII